MELTSGKVSYYSLNGSGEINRMVPQQRHRRRHHYGVLTHMAESLGEGSMPATPIDTMWAAPPTSSLHPSTRYPVAEASSLVDATR